MFVEKYKVSYWSSDGAKEVMIFESTVVFTNFEVKSQNVCRGAVCFFSISRIF